VMVVAGPGTGKTTILTLRIAQILQKTDTPPSGILAITYTDAGVKAMRGKLREVIDARADEVKINTFHSFASSIITELGEHFPHLSNATQMTDVEIEVVIRDILKDKAFTELRPLGNPDLYIGSIIRAISEVKHEAFTPDMARSFALTEAKRIEQDENSISTRGKTKGQLKAEAKQDIEKCKRTELFADVYARYEAKKKEDKRMDYDDLIIELLVAFQNDELLLRLIQERFLYILVDEHQDTNDSQNLLISQLSDFFDTPNVFIVGDEKQAIYRFQGASVENFLKFQHAWKDMKVISLETNYRSHQGILDASFAMIENNYAEGEHLKLRKQLKSDAKVERRKISIITAPDDISLDAYFLGELEELTRKEPKATVAIIVRRNRELDRVLNLLETKGISVSSERKIDIFSHPVGALFFNLIEYIADPSATYALAKTLVAGLWQLSFDEMSLCLQSLRSGRGSGVEKYIPALSKIRKEILSDAPVSFLINLAELSGFRDRISRDPSFVEVWRGITELSESVAREGNIRSPLELIERLLAYRTSAEKKSVKVSVGVSDHLVRAMTAHGSKGLEFDYVFIPYASEESWIGRAHGNHFVLPKKLASGDNVADTRRLFYVALTRARKHITILSAEEEAGGRSLSPLRFISELDPKDVLASSIEKKELPPTSKESAERVSNQKLLDYAKRMLLEKGLSVTALNHFMNCPSKFVYQSILKLPQAPAPSAEKGTVMHEAFSRVWKSEKRDAKITERCILQALIMFERRTLLANFEKEAVSAELRENVPIVAKALEPHFALEGKVFTEEWIGSEFESGYGGASFRIPIHGKLDAIVDAPKEVLVFDYKTKQAMSSAEIKGETKNSDGNYFRQLVFYRLLLEQDARFKGKAVSPALVFVSPDDKGRCPTIALPIEKSDIEKVKSEIQTLVLAVWSGKILTDVCEDKKCEWCGLKKFVVNSL